MSLSIMTNPGSMAKKEEHQRRDRSRRVVVLIGGIILLSVGDLVITLTYLQSTGMVEANPIAGYLIELTRSVAALTAYKALTVGVCVTLLYLLRRRIEGEVAAWCAVAILALMSLLWHNYSRQFSSLDDIRLVQGSADGDGWLVLD